MFVASVLFAVSGLTGVLPMAFSSVPVELAGFSTPWWAMVAELAILAAATPYVTGIIATRVLGAKLASFVGLSEVMFAVLFAWVLLGELPHPVQLLGGLFILAGVVAVRSEGEAPASAIEPGLAVRPAHVGDGAVVAHDWVELRGDDVVMAQDHGRAVGAVQEYGPM